MYFVDFMIATSFRASGFFVGKEEKGKNFYKPVNNQVRCQNFKNCSKSGRFFFFFSETRISVKMLWLYILYLDITSDKSQIQEQMEKKRTPRTLEE